MHNLDIESIKIVKYAASCSLADAEKELNNLFEEGYVLLNISTVAPQELPGGESYDRSNFYIWQLAKLKTRKL